MRTPKLSLILFLLVFAFFQGLLAEGEDHHHDEEHEEHSEHEENAHVGSGKGILEADKHIGIKLSPNAEKTFEISRVKVTGLPISINSAAIVDSGEERNLFRYRDGFYKRIDFSLSRGTGESFLVTSDDLKVGDEIVTRGLGFLRIAEIAAFGGAPEGHSH